MARDGSGTYTRVSNTFTSPISGTPISPVDAEALWDELDTEITDSLSRSGKGGMSADLDMNNNDINEIKTAVFQGSTSGNTTVIATAIAGTTTLTLPAATDTLVGKATTDTLTNKTLTSPVMTTPDLGTPSALVLTNATGTPSSIGLANGTGLPISTGVSGLGTGVATFLATPSSANLRTALTDETGTGGAVFATSPTITTPNIVGTATNDSASAGSVGEYTESVILQASAEALVTNTGNDIAQITLAAGDWDVSGSIGFIPAASTSITVLHGSWSTAADTANTTIGRYFQHAQPAAVPGAVPMAFSLPTYRFSLSGSTTVRLVALATFTVAGLSAFGIIRARRVR